jgi:hypothetical protein
LNVFHGIVVILSAKEKFWPSHAVAKPENRRKKAVSN